MLRYLALAASCLAAEGARAETIIVRPDPCPAPAGVEILRGPGSADLERREDDLVPVIYFVDHRRPGWASRLILARFDVEGRDTEAGCAAPQ